MHENSLKNLEKGAWKSGQSGNPAGRPISSRNRLTEQFLKDTAAVWSKHGAQILEGMATNEPSRFADLCSRLIPKDVQLSLQHRLPANLEPDDWELMMGVMEAVKAALPDANQRKPSEVLSFVQDAIRAHDAKLIESSEPCSDVANTLPKLANKAE